MSTIDSEMTGAGFDAWQYCLFEFVMKNRRPCTAEEWRWLRFRFETEELGASQEPLSLAADGETVENRMLRESVKTKKTVFSTEDGQWTVEITLRPQLKGDPVVYVKMADHEGQPAIGGKLLFPGIEQAFVTDDHGRITISYADYMSYLKQVMGLVCEPPGQSQMDLKMEQ